MSLSTMRKNFYRISTLIIDHGAESMRCLLDQFIQTKYRMSFRDFVTNNQHDIYHHFNNGICCLCSKNYRRPFKTVISSWQMEKLFDKKSPKLSGHKYSSKCDYCCSTVRSTLLLQDIDITLLKFYLVTYFEEEFWQSCFASGMVFHDFLNTHKHDIFHLLQLNTSCCLCQASPGYTPMACMVLTEKDRLNRTQWETMFHTSELPCTQHRNNFSNGYTLNPCSVSATKGVRHSDLDGRARVIILSKFCTMMMHIDVLVNTRNTVFAHAIKGELSDEEFRQLWIEIENSIIYVSNVTSTVDSQKPCILNLKEKSLEESMCLELQCLILKQMHGDELVLESCSKLQDTVEMVKESIDLKLQQVELQITAFTSNMSNIVRNELSVQLNEYSDTTRNIIDNTRREIEFHDEDNTYVRTSAVTTAIKLLDSNNLLILFGRAGSGKTSTALDIASLFHANGYIIMKLEQNLAPNFKTYFISKNKQLIIFEDLFGKADIRYNSDIHSNLIEVLKPHVFNGDSKFIITIRSYRSEVDDEIATYHELLSKAGVINLNGSLSKLEKESILTMHATQNKLEICLSNMQQIIATDSYLGFPEASRLFCSFENFFAMGHVFFSSPTEVLQKEISDLKKYGYHNIDSALHYSVLICLMMDSACNDSFGDNIYRVAHESNDPSNNVKNINCSVIEYIYNSVFYKEIMITIEMLQEICKQLSNKYIKNNVNSNTYVFQHQTVFEAVLSSYWHKKTMENVIKYFKADILAEHFRPFDSIVKGYKTFLIVPKNKCTDLAHTLFETFLANYNEIFTCFSLIKQSEFILDLFNRKLDEWFTTEEHILKCDWIIIMEFIRPLKYKKDNNIICANANDKYLIQRLSNELVDKAYDVNRYIERYCCDEFAKHFYENVKQWFQTEENIVNCDWEVMHYFIRPTTYKMKTGQVGTVTNDDWLIQRLINKLKEPNLQKLTDGRCYKVEKYIERYGSEKIVNCFNEKLAEWFQSEETVLNCNWEVIDYFIRPTTFEIETGYIRTVTNDDWLIQRLINELVEPISHTSTDRRTCEVTEYIERHGSEKFVICFNEKLAGWFESEETVLNCNWEVIDYFIRPTTFEIETGHIGTVTNDDWLIRRLMKGLKEHLSHKLTDRRSYQVQKYIEKYGSEKFVMCFKEKLAGWFQSEETVLNCNWEVIDYFIRPTTFKMETGYIGTVTNDGWLIQRLINELKESISHTLTDGKTYNVEKYLARYGCEKIVNCFNQKLAELFQSKDTVITCDWEVIYYFIRPTTFKMKTGQIGTFTNDDWLIQRLINRLKEPFSNESDGRTDEIEKYIEKYGCDDFVKHFNEKLAELFQSEDTVINCDWEVIYYFVRPTTFQIATNYIGTVTKDDWLIQRLINRLKEPISHRLERRTDEVQKYIEEYGCEEFVICFNEKLAEWFKLEETVLKCDWKVIDYFIRPTLFKMETCQKGTVTNDDWLIQRLINKLKEPVLCQLFVEREYEVHNFIQKYACEEFVICFNEKLAEWFQSEETVLKCDWNVIEYFIRPTTFKVETGHIGTVTNDDWLIRRLINRLAESVSYNLIVEKTYQVKNYIERYECEMFVNNFNERLKEWFQSEENVGKCDLHIFTTFVRPQSWLCFEKNVIYIHDEHIISYLFSKLEQQTNVNTVKSYIRNYGSYEFKTNFNERLKEKLTRACLIDNHTKSSVLYLRNQDLEPECTWECLEHFFDNDTYGMNKFCQDFNIDMEAISDMYSMLSIETKNHSAESESDANTDEKINHFEDGSIETHYNNDANNGVFVLME